ncbi:MAG: hypothetical protein AAGL68_08540 [Pseudomonadota bacterium]
MKTTRILAPVLAALALAACGEAGDTTYDTDVVDEGGGELIVDQPDPNAVPVDLPETPMTNVPPEGSMPEEPDLSIPDEVKESVETPDAESTE